MFPQMLVASALVLTMSGVQPPSYSEKGLCELWAGARCHASACLPDGKQRCAADSVQCRGKAEQPVPEERAGRVVACARALLQASCGGPSPAECAGVDAP